MRFLELELSLLALDAVLFGLSVALQAVAQEVEAWACRRTGISRTSRAVRHNLRLFPAMVPFRQLSQFRSVRCLELCASGFTILSVLGLAAFAAVLSLDLLHS